MIQGPGAQICACLFCVDSTIPCINFFTRPRLRGEAWGKRKKISSVFDSNFRGYLSSSLTHQLAVIYRNLIVQEEVDPYFKIHAAIQQQSGGNDCGIFAITFALHSLLGETLETVQFDQSK